METTISIEGMHCASCETLLTDVLADLPGVQSASVSLKSKSASVRFDETAVTERQLRDAIEQEGYTTH